jgi:hypothetical protein
VPLRLSLVFPGASRHPIDLDLLEDLPLVVHCPLLVGPSAAHVLEGAVEEGACCGTEMTVPKVESLGSQGRHHGRGGICTWL